MLIFCLLAVAHCFEAVPLLLASHRLVPDLAADLKGSWHDPYPVEVATNMVKRAITPCLLDEYVIVNIPGLTNADLTDDLPWDHTRRYLHMALTVVAAPWVEAPLDLDFLEQYVIERCDAETIPVVNGRDEEVYHYKDTRTRVIRIDYEELDINPQQRRRQLAAADDLVRKIVRKLPLPHYTIIITSSEVSNVHPVPRLILREYPENYHLFHLISQDPLRANQVERNDRFHRGEPEFAAARHTNDRYLRNRRHDEVHFFDYELWTKNDKVVMTLFVMAVTWVVVKLRQLLRPSPVLGKVKTG